MYAGLGLAAKIDPATKEREEARIWMTVSLVTSSYFASLSTDSPFLLSPVIMPGTVVVSRAGKYNVGGCLLFEHARHKLVLKFRCLELPFSMFSSRYLGRENNQTYDYIYCV